MSSPCAGRPHVWHPVTPPTRKTPEALRLAAQQRKDAVRWPIAQCQRRCPILRECAAVACSTQADSGVWAGIDLGDGTKRGKGWQKKMDALKSIAEGAL